MDSDLPPLGVAAPSPVPSPRPSGPPPEPAVWPPSAQWAAALLLVVAIALLARHWFQGQRGSTRPTTLEPTALRLDINDADEAQLRQLPGVGPALAVRILEQRRQRGGFQTVEDLREVRGIGPATLERLRPLLQIGSYDEEEAPSSEPPTRVVRGVAPQEAAERPAGTRKKEPPAVLDINRAGTDQLQKLPGIGPKLAEAIVTTRSVRPFASVEELRRVKGIGPKTLERLRPYVMVGER
jgi:competence protein ComEA